MTLGTLPWIVSARGRQLSQGSGQQVPHPGHAPTLPCRVCARRPAVTRTPSRRLGLGAPWQEGGQAGGPGTQGLRDSFLLEPPWAHRDTAATFPCTFTVSYRKLRSALWGRCVRGGAHLGGRPSPVTWVLTASTPLTCGLWSPRTSGRLLETSHREQNVCRVAWPAHPRSWPPHLAGEVF